jgi:hypothetical protein
MGGVLVDSETIERWERLISEGDRDPVVREFLHQVGGYDQPALDEMARTQLWEARKQVAPTLPRELRAELAHRIDPEALATVTAPALLLVGTESPDWATRSTERTRRCCRTPRRAGSRARDTAPTSALPSFSPAS